MGHELFFKLGVQPRDYCEHIDGCLDALLRCFFGFVRRDRHYVIYRRFQPCVRAALIVFPPRQGKACLQHRSVCRGEVVLRGEKLRGDELGPVQPVVLGL